MFELPPPPENTIPLTTSCVIEAAQHFDVPARALFAILQVEGGNVGEVNHNTNHTVDIGPMQINSIWLDELSDYINETELLYNGCYNVFVGTWILKSRIIEANDLWTGIGHYHSRTPHLSAAYQQKVYAASRSLPSARRNIGEE